MTGQNEQAAIPSVNHERQTFLRSLRNALLRWILRGLECGQLVIDTPSGDKLAFEGTRPGPRARLSIRRWRCLWRLITGSDIGFAKSFLSGDWSSPNMTSLFTLAIKNRAVAYPLPGVRPPCFAGRFQHALNRNTRHGSRRNIASHYDLGNEFYRHWLDSGMSYSSALFASNAQTLEEAQNTKLDRVLDLLDLSSGQHVLEIGCGWGSFAERLLERTDCTLTGLTLSVEQLAYAQRRLCARGLSERGDLRLQDYRDAQGRFDRIVSIEMLEAVGEAYWPLYFRTIRDRLRLGGIAVLQVITIDEDLFSDYRRRPDFIQQYIFPGGMLPTRHSIHLACSNAGLRLSDATQFGESYARTLDEWHRRFQRSWPQIANGKFDERFKRMWEYYLSYCRAGFETGALQVGLYKLTR
jgi:cyclopropane-fatty-acyl-phospholipid synthase